MSFLAFFLLKIWFISKFCLVLYYQINHNGMKDLKTFTASFKNETVVATVCVDEENHAHAHYVHPYEQGGFEFEHDETATAVLYQVNMWCGENGYILWSY